MRSVKISRSAAGELQVIGGREGRQEGSSACREMTTPVNWYCS